MNARGTRRPHSTRPYKRARSKSRTKGKGCALWLLAFASLPPILLALMERL